MPVSGPERCPACNYDLRGLPVPHRCPECGLAYDEHTRIWRPARPWRIIAVLIPFWLPLGPILLNFRSPPAVGRWSVGILAVFVVASTTFALFRILRSNRAGRFVALLPDGIRIRSHCDDGLVGWMEFDRAEMESLKRVVLLSRGNPRRTLDLQYLLKAAETPDFVKEIRRARARYASTPPQWEWT